MPERRRRKLRRDSLVFLGSLVAHLLVFYVAGRELFHPYPMPQEEPAAQVELVPEPMTEIPPPPIPIVKPKPERVTTPPTPQPQPQPQPKPVPQPVAPAPEKITSKTVVKSTAPTKPTALPTLTAPKQSILANLPTAPIEAPAPGPPKTLSKSNVVSAQPQRLVPAAPLNLHKPKEASAGLAPPANIPGSFTPPGGGAPGGGAPGGGTGSPSGPNAGPLRGGGLPPGFGEGLRGSLLGCINADVAHLSAEQQARCADRLGTGVREAPQMSAIDASRRADLDAEAARQKATSQYLNSTPGSSAHGNAEDPRLRDTVKGGGPQ